MSLRDQELRSKAARGNALTSDGEPLLPARLHWTDPDTGDRLRIDLWGSEAFLVGLASLGFELEGGTPDAADSGRTGGSRRAGSSAEPAGGSRAGSAPSLRAGDAA